MIDVNGNWYPTMFPKQVAVFNDRAIYQLLSGPRYCGKTIGAVHRVVKHLWTTNPCRFAIFTRSQKTGKNGIWTDDLIANALPEWFEHVPGFEPAPGFEGQTPEGQLTVAPLVDGSTRMNYFRVRNMHGGLSEVQLHSLHHDEDATPKLRSTRFSGIMVDELDNFDSSEIFDVGILQLRMLRLPVDRHLFIATTNPPENGQKHWIYRKWYQDKMDQELPEEHRAKLSVHEFTIEDNSFADPSFVTTLKANYRSDPDMYDRMVLGKWTASSTNSLFTGAFQMGTHVIGDASSKYPEDHTVIYPSDNCAEIFVGWDIGDVNHAVVFLERLVIKGVEIWCVLDEVVSIGTDLSIKELTAMVLDHMAALEVAAGKRLSFLHWSDKSAERFRSAADATDELTVQLESKGQITLRSCPKPPGSVRGRIALVRQFLASKRLFISAHCDKVIDALRYLRKGKGEKPIAPGPNLHPFDALSYPLYAENIEQIETAIRPAAPTAEMINLRV